MSETFAVKLPAPLPKGWRRIVNELMMALGAPDPDHCPCFKRNDGLFVMLTCARELDGKLWKHVSISRQDRLPSWYDLKDVKAAFLPENCMAIQVLPRDGKFVNIHENCLHLWHCLEADPVPDFTHGMGTI